MPGRRLYVTDAIVLSRFDFGEADRILTLLTPELGKIKAIAKGIRRPTSRIGGALEPLAELRIQLAKGRTFDVVTQVTMQHTWLGLRDGLEVTATAWYCAELAERSLEERHAALPVYLLLRRTYELLDAGMAPARVARWFEMRLCDELGVRPEVDRCVECDRLLAPDDAVRWVPALGGALCADHPGPSAMAAGLSTEALKVLKAYQRMDVEALAGLRLPPAVEREVEERLGAFVRHVMERDTRSRRFLEEVKAGYGAVAAASGPLPVPAGPARASATIRGTVLPSAHATRGPLVELHPVTDPQPDPNAVAPAVANLDVIVSLAKRRGFVFPSSEIYGGINAVWDYGPLGVELKNNVKRAWWRAMVQERDDIVGLDSGILMHPQIWVTSGHVAEFNDPMVECASCRRRYRVDEFAGTEDLGPKELLDPGIVARLGLACPNDGGPLGAPRRFNLMLKTFLGPVEDEAAVVYLRPETAQGIYVNFRNVREASRKKLPFGIAQIGKAFRNEISPGNFVFRMREFEQMEMQYFVRPETAADHFEAWLPRRRAWYEAYGVAPERLRFREHRPDELAHYAKKAIDVEYRFPFGWKELEGIHNRGDWDLGRHTKESGENLEYFDPATEEHFIPWIVETSAGADRAAFTFLIDAYREEEVRGEKRVVLGIHPDLAPYKVAVLPLLKKRPEIVELCHRIKDDLKRQTMAVYDDTAAIGKLYRRQDEIGTPWCVTVDVDSLEDGKVTVRDRDAMTQERISADQVTRYITDKLDEARPRGL